MNTAQILALTTAITVGFGGMAHAQEAKDVKNAEPREWLSLTGEVATVSADEFTLDYGENDITVEMDDFDVYDENFVLAGDEVTVTGRIDADFAGSKRLEANSVYVASLNEYFYASAADEEDGYYSFAATDYWDGGDWISLTGEVTSIDGSQFTLNAASTDYTVETDNLANNPLDDKGKEQIEIGERVVVSGEFETFDLFSGEVIEAEAVTTLSGAATS